MKYRLLGKSKFSCSEVGLGCWQFGGDFGDVSQAEVHSILDAALISGVSFWDTADVYGAGLSERLIGSYLKNHADRCKDVVVATKLGRSAELYPNNYSEASLRASIEQSLMNLQKSSLDLIQLHCVPPELLAKPDLFIYLEKFKAEGLVKAYGASVETISEAKMCLQHEGLTSLQMIINVFRQDAVEELFDQAKLREVGIIARLPLASGLLSGKFTEQSVFSEQDHRNYNCDGQMFNVGETFSGLPFDKGLQLVETLRLLMPKQLDLASASLRWLLDHDAVTSVIAGVSKAEQIQRNAKVSSMPSLPAVIHQELKVFYRNLVRPNVRGDI